MEGLIQIKHKLVCHGEPKETQVPVDRRWKETVTAYPMWRTETNAPGVFTWTLGVKEEDYVRMQQAPESYRYGTAEETIEEAYQRFEENTETDSP